MFAGRGDLENHADAAGFFGGVRVSFGGSFGEMEL
jgi:hypothetical protein